MNASNLENLLNLNWSLLKQALPSFERSLVKCRDIDFLPPISFETEEALDSLSSKFSRVSDIYTQKVIKTLLFLLREDAPTFLDRMNLCEKTVYYPQCRGVDCDKRPSQYHCPSILERKPGRNLSRNHSIIK